MKTDKRLDNHLSELNPLHFLERFLPIVAVLMGTYIVLRANQQIAYGIAVIIFVIFNVGLSEFQKRLRVDIGFKVEFIRIVFNSALFLIVPWYLQEATPYWILMFLPVFGNSVYIINMYYRWFSIIVTSFFATLGMQMVYNDWLFAFEPFVLLIGVALLLHGIVGFLTNHIVKQYESLEESNVQLEQANQDLQQFAYVATHDIKVPIGNINNYLTFLKKDDDIKNERSKSAILWIDASVEQAMQTISDLVMVAKARTEGQIELEDVDLFELLDEAKSNLRSEIEASNAIIKADFDYPTLRYSKVRGRSLIQNLLSNALKYRSPERQPVIEFSSVRDNGHVRLSIRDNGIGINMERDGEKVFGLFKRAHSKVSGTGLGLYMVKQSIDSIGGSIEVQSEPDKGATFIVKLKNE